MKSIICKSILSIVVLFGMAFTLRAQVFVQDNIFGVVDTTPVEMAELTVENLQGAWKVSNRRRYDLAGDEMYETVVLYNHIYIEGNTIWELEYPSQMYSKKTFEIKDSVIHILNSKNLLVPSIKPYAMYLGTSGVCNYGVTADKQLLCFGGQNYHKDSLDVEVINKLKNGKFNSDALVGKWKLTTSFDSGYDGWGIVNYIHPWELSSEMNITKGNVHRFYAGRLMYLKINGEKRPFIIKEVHISEWSGELVLTPERWYEEPEEEEYNNEEFIGVKTSTVIYEFNSYDQ